MFLFLKKILILFIKIFYLKQFGKTYNKLIFNKKYISIKFEIKL